MVARWYDNMMRGDYDLKKDKKQSVTELSKKEKEASAICRTQK